MSFRSRPSPALRAPLPTVIALLVALGATPARADLPVAVSSDYDAEFARAVDLLEEGKHAEAEAVLEAILKAAPKVSNSPSGVRDLAEAYALLERNLIPNAGVVQHRT